MEIQKRPKKTASVIHAKPFLGSEDWSITAKLCDSCKTISVAVICAFDSAFLYLGCDAEVHATNKLASRHGGLWLCEVCEQAPAVDEKAEAASWLFPTEDSESSEYEVEYLFNEMDLYLDLDLISDDQKPLFHISDHKKQYSSNGVVPEQNKNEFTQPHFLGPVVDGFPTYSMNYPGSMPFIYKFSSQFIS
ncbi:zinc finger protein CONSTANS-LIKE 4-like [Forsythia ovata]|uniref:Zinc finger protein CONSTANS-LIKE 4-like n=1 Tax=Forsythia ovata TaxID=205694 RepID=A0ABD1PKI8_9LAMI